MAFIVDLKIDELHPRPSRMFWIDVMNIHHHVTSPVRIFITVCLYLYVVIYKVRITNSKSKLGLQRNYIQVTPLILVISTNTLHEKINGLY